jgi:hypothetical protein
MRTRFRGFPARLLLIVALALAVRWVAVFAHYGDLPLELDDNYGYHKQAQLLLDHGGFYEPFVYKDSLERQRQLIDVFLAPDVPTSPAPELSAEEIRARSALYAEVPDERFAEVLNGDIDGLRRVDVPVDGSAEAGVTFDVFAYTEGSYDLEQGGVLEPSAGHPPGYTSYLAVFGVVGLDSPTANRLASGLAGAIAVGLAGIAARWIGRRAGLTEAVADRAGLIAAFLAAVYPNLWINDALILSESLYAALTGLVILAAYRFWNTPTGRNAALLGAACGVAALTRSEGLLWLPFLVLPLAVRLRDTDWARRLTLAVGAGLVALALMAPWMIRNVATFEEPAPPFLATGSGRVLAFGNCDLTYSGRFLGYWNIDCAPPEFSGDESEIDTIHREKATEFMQDHRGELPKVALARVGRMWQVFRTDQGVEFDRFFERRGLDETRFALGQYYLMVPVAVAGAVLLWRRRVTVIPLLAPFVLVTFTAASTFGITRYRVPSEVALTILAGLGLAWVTSRDPVEERP